jgi:hypothetical protein
MKKVIVTLCFLGIFGYANANTVRVLAGFPYMATVEYERSLDLSLLGSLSAYVNYGASDVTFKNFQTKLNGVGAGVRYRIPFLFTVGVGYAGFNRAYSYEATVAGGGVSVGDTVSVDAKSGGFLVSLSKYLTIGPVSAGGIVYLLNATPNSVKTRVDSQSVTVSQRDLKGAATITWIPGIAVGVGYSF